VSKATAHRRFVAWTEAGLWRRLHRAVLDRLGERAAIDWSRAVVYVATSLDPGSSACWATSASSIRSICSPSSWWSLAAQRIAAPMPRRSRAGPAATPAQPAGVEDLHLGAGGRRDRLVGLEDAGDGGHQSTQCFPVDLVDAAEVVDHLGYRAADHRMAFAVRPLQMAHHRAVPVGPPRLPRVHAYTSPTQRWPVRTLAIRPNLSIRCGTLVKGGRPAPPPWPRTRGRPRREPTGTASPRPPTA
jgi:hypothetical protein